MNRFNASEFFTRDYFRFREEIALEVLAAKRHGFIDVVLSFNFLSEHALPRIDKASNEAPALILTEQREIDLHKVDHVRQAADIFRPKNIVHCKAISCLL